MSGPCAQQPVEALEFSQDPVCSPYLLESHCAVRPHTFPKKKKRVRRVKKFGEKKVQVQYGIEVRGRGAGQKNRPLARAF